MVSPLWPSLNKTGNAGTEPWGWWSFQASLSSFPSIGCPELLPSSLPALSCRAHPATQNRDSVENQGTLCSGTPRSEHTGLENSTSLMKNLSLSVTLPTCPSLNLCGTQTDNTPASWALNHGLCSSTHTLQKQLPVRGVSAPLPMPGSYFPA